MNKRKVALALVAALGINTLAVTVGNVNGQVQIAHAQEARLTNPEEIKQLSLSEVKSLTTSVVSETNNGSEKGYVEVSIDKIGNKNVSELNIKSITAYGASYSKFDERKVLNLDSIPTVTASASETPNNILIKGVTQAGIYKAIVKVVYNAQNGLEEKVEEYELTLVKQPKDYLELGQVELFPSGIKVAKQGTIVKSYYDSINGGKASGHEIINTQGLSLWKDGVKVADAIENASTNNTHFLFNIDESKLKDGDIYTVKANYADGSVVTHDIIIQENATPTIKTNYIDFSTEDTIKQSLAEAYGVDKSIIGLNKNLVGDTAKIHNRDYEVQLKGKTDISFRQTYNNDFIGITANSNGPIVVSTDNNELTLNLQGQKIKTDATDGFIAFKYIDKNIKRVDGNNNVGNIDQPTLLGQYLVSVIGNGINPDPQAYVTGIDPFFSAGKDNLDNNYYLRVKDPVQLGITLKDKTSTPKFKYNVDQLKHGLNTITLKFSVDDLNGETEKELNKLVIDAANSSNELDKAQKVEVITTPVVETTFFLNYDKYQVATQYVGSSFIPQSENSDKGNLVLYFNGDVRNILANNNMIDITVDGGKVFSTSIVNDPVMGASKSTMIVVSAEIPKSVREKGINWSLTTKYKNKLSRTASQIENYTVNLENPIQVENKDSSSEQFLLKNVSVKIPNTNVTKVSYNGILSTDVENGNPILISNFDTFKNNNGYNFATLNNQPNRIIAKVGEGNAHQGSYEVGIWVDPLNIKVDTEVLTQNTTTNSVKINVKPVYSTQEDINGVTGKVVYKESATANWDNAQSVTVNDVTQNSTLDIAGLKENTSYDFKVVFMKGEKVVAESNVVKETTKVSTVVNTVSLTSKNVTNNGVTLTVDPSFDVNTANKAVVSYKKSSYNGWTNTKVFTSDELKKDPVDITITPLEENTSYDFKVAYYSDLEGTVEIASNIITNVVTTSSTTENNNGTVSGNGGSASNSTTGNSVGSITINTNNNNTVKGNSNVTVTLPSSVRYDNGKMPVLVNSKYKAKDGKVVVQKRDEYSNVKSMFEGDKVKLDGLVPGKDYAELHIDYTDNNGKTRTIVLRNVKIESNVEADKYLANVYTVVFNRPADENGYHYHLGNLKEKKVKLREFLLNMVMEKEFVEVYKTSESKIEALYSAIVGREADKVGKDFWVNEYKKMLSVYGSESATLKAIADRMVNEKELKELATKINFEW